MTATASPPIAPSAPSLSPLGILRWRPHRGDLVIAVPLMILTGVSLFGLALAPVVNPVVVMLLTPKLVFLVLAAERLDMWAFVLLAGLRLGVADPFTYALGRRYGAEIRARASGWRIGRLLTRLAPTERWCVRVAVLLRPSGGVLAWAGSLRLSPGLVAALDVAGTVMWLIALYEGAHILFG